MIKQNELVPKRRFEGFVDEWKKEKTGEFYDVKSGYAFNRNEYVESGIPIINGESIHYGKINKKNLNYLPKEYIEKYSNFKVEAADIVIGLNRPIINNNLKIAQVPKRLKNSLLYQRAGKVVNLKNIDIDFSYHLLGNEVFKFVLKEAVGSDQPFISTNKLKEWFLWTPKEKREQQKIGRFFKHLDEMIAQQQRKIDKTKALKSAYLAEMFPAEGEHVPKRRYEGFVDEWKIYQFENIIDMYNNLRIPVTASDRIPGNTPYYGANGIQDYVQGSTHEGEFVLIAEDGANDLTNYPVQYVNGKAWVNNHAHIVSGKENIIDNLFLVSRMKSMNISKWLVGGGRAKLNAEVLKIIQIKIPSFQEQEQIGLLFKHLDEMIATQQQKLEKLKATKQAYLHEMFV